ncbi:MAG: xanthine dehydrogenase family protein subunit M [Melioribacteraceae bacterium]|nr:xanthine dehydrogenase family protein subunit M [Melioribacteraceae bacterium]
MTDFDYIQPTTLQEASKVLSSDGINTLIYAGGTDALSLLKNDIYKQHKVLNLKKIEGLNYISFDKTNGLRIGALATISEIGSSPEIKENYNIIHEAANEIASPQLRNMGTLGGNLCQRPRCWYYREDFDCIRKGGGECFAYEGRNKFHCIVGGGPCYIVHPSDMAVALLALDAKVVIHSNNGERTIPINDLYVLPQDDPMNETILKPGEIVKEIQVQPPVKGIKSGYVKFKERDTWDFAVVSVGAVINSTNGIINNVNIAFGGIAPKPWSEKSLNKSLSSVRINENELEGKLKNLFSNAETLSENAYKVPLVRNLTKRLLLRLVQ